MMYTMARSKAARVICAILAGMMILTTIVGAMAVPAEAATKKKVYVVTKETVMYAAGKKSTNTYKYNKSGLLTSIKYPGYSEKLQYDSKNRVKKYTQGKNMVCADFQYNKNGKVIQNYARFEGDMVTYSNYTYNKKGLIKKAVYFSTYTNTYKYDSKNRLLSYKRTGTDGPKTNVKDIKYDSKGQIKSYTENGVKHKVLNTYKNGRLVKRVDQVMQSGRYQTVETHTYSYKSVSVPASVLSRVKSQQNYAKQPIALPVYIF